MAKRVGVIGGYGRTGSVVVKEILRTTDSEVLVGGRDVERAALVAKLYGGRACATYVDVFDSEALADFSNGCFLLVNCAGPSSVIQDRVAQAAIRNNCHYIDPGGYKLLRDKLMPMEEELNRRGLVFLLSAGLFPGLTEVFPMYVHLAYSLSFKTVEDIEVYFGDLNDWSSVATVDQLTYIDSYAFKAFGFYKSGEWVAGNALNSWRTIRFPEPLGRQLVLLHFFPELREFSTRQRHLGIRSYLGLISLRTIMAMSYFKWVMKNKNAGKAVPLLKRALKCARDRSNHAGFLTVILKGKKDKQASRVTATVCEYEHYWMTGAVPATAARMIIEDRISARGCSYLADGVDPLSFIREMETTGMKYEIARGQERR